MAMLGALARTGAIPLSAKQIRETIGEKTKREFVETNLKAFDLGMEASTRVDQFSRLWKIYSGK